MQPKNKLALIGIGIAISPFFALAQEQDPATKLLMDQARFWKAKEDYSRSAMLYKKVLMVNPNQTEAIYGIAQNDLKKKNIAGVNQAIERLKKIQPNSNYIAVLEQDITLQTDQSAKILSNARILAESGKIDESVAKYNVLLDGKVPQGTLALEYYSRLAYTDTGWSSAKAGLERLVKQSPNDVEVKLQLAKIMLLKENSRLDGIVLLSKLSTDSAVGSDASESWRLGLLWYKVPQPNAFPVFETYIKAHPDDKEVRELLNNGLKQQQASIAGSSPGRVAGVGSGINDKDARAEDAFESARKSLANGDDIAARASLDKSLKLNPDNPWARFSLARLNLKSGQVRAAKDLMFDMPYSDTSNQVGILFASALFSIDIQDWKKAQVYLEQIPQKDRTPEMKELQKTIVAREQIDQATMLSKRGNTAAGLAKLNQIQLASSNDFAVTSVLATAYVELGENKRGVDLMRQVIANSKPPKTEELIQYANLLLKAKEDSEAANVLAQLEKRQLTGTNKSSFNDLLFVYSLRQADELRKNGNLPAAEARLAPLLVQRPNDPAVINTLASVYQDSGQNLKALDMYKKLVQQNPRNIDIRLGAARLALRADDRDFANANLEAILSLAPKDPDVIASLARIYRSEGQNKQAETLFERSVALMAVANQKASTPESTQAASTKQFTSNAISTLSGSSIPLPASSVTVASESSLSTTSGASQSVSYLATPISDSQRQIMTELNEIKQERSSTVLAGIQIRNRSGNAGTSKLTDIEAPIQISLPVDDGKATAQITPVSLNAGSIAANSFASNPFGTGNTPSQSQTASGVGLSVGYKVNGLTIDAGTTPIGFTYTNVTGGVKYDSTLDEAKTLSYTVNLSSRPVTDSLLSFAGAKNNSTGQKWGGVMASGGRFNLSKDLGGYGFYGSAAFYNVAGHNVESNSRRDFGVGTYVNIYRRPDSELTTGLNYTNFGFKQNLSNFTYGQGGYFSPQQYSALTIPVMWAQSTEELSYQLRAGIGYQSYTQNSSNYFPTNGALQAASSNSVFPSQSSTGVSYNLAANSEFKVASKLYFGVTAQTDNTATGTWRQWGAGAYLRFTFEEIDGLMPVPLKAFSSPYGL